LQRRILFVLEGAGESLSPSEIRSELGNCDRSNVRRAIRGLIDRGFVEEAQGRLALTLWGGVRAQLLSQKPYEVLDPLKEARERRRELEAAVTALRTEIEEKRRLNSEIEALWDKSGRSFKRRRFPGPNQLRVIAVLVRYAENPQLGLPKGAVWRIAGGARTNTLRAIRTLTRRGILQQTKDGERLRIAYWATSWFWDYTQDVVEPPLDDAKAQAILDGFGERGVSRNEGTPWKSKTLPERV